MKLDQALKICLPLVRTKTKHLHYPHVVDLTEKYYRPLITGEGADHLIQRFNQRESPDAHTQRLRLTTLITPAICNTLIAPARKIPKVKPVVDTATFGADQKDKDKTLKDATSAFYAGKSVDHYFGSILLDQGAIDPNAFMLTLFDNFDERFEKPKVYPSIIGAKDAWNYEYFNGELQWLWVHRDIKFEEKQPLAKPKKNVPSGNEPEMVIRDGHAFWLYTDQNHVMFTQVDSTTIASLSEGVVISANGKPLGTAAPAMNTREAYYYRASKSELYEVSFYEHKSGLVQAFRLGYVPDQRTKGQTMVNLWHAALPYLLKGIKSGSELDLSAALHAFLREYSYGPPCKGYNTKDGDKEIHVECLGGTDVNGNICKKCGGDGMFRHESGQDHVQFALPPRGDVVQDLSKMVYYVPLPVEVLTWQDGYVTKLEKACYTAVYNSDRFRTPDATNTTATGDIIDLQSVYDALKPGADWYSRSRVLVYKLIASFVVGSESLKNLDVSHEFPRNMRFETVGERVLLLKSLREASASDASIAQVNDDLLEDLYVDDPVALKKARVQAAFQPFSGKSEGAIVTMISQDNTKRELKVLWTNFSYVFAEAEERTAENTSEPVNFYDMARGKQQKLVDEIVEELIADMDEQGEATMERAQLGVAPEEAEDAATPDEGDSPEPPGSASRNGLPASPGNSATGGA